MTGPREWRHAEGCIASSGSWKTCTCGLSAVRDAIAQGHRAVVGPDGVEGRLVSNYVVGVSSSYTPLVVPLEEP